MSPDYLSEAEKTLVVSFVKNKATFDAVKKVLLYTIYNQGVVEPGKTPSEMNWVFALAAGETMSNDQLGHEVRASLAALGYLKGGFETLSAIHIEEPKKAKSNPAL
jgi:hypothetical protein